MPEQKPKQQKHAGGRPPVNFAPKYTSPEAMQAKIDEYFKWCEGRYLRDEEGEPVLTKYGEPIILDSHPLTVTGLAYALGFRSRDGLLRYQGKQEFAAVIQRAKLRIEQYAEERLYDKDGAAGARFVLQNGFGWQDPNAAQNATEAVSVKIVCDIPKPEPAATETEAVNADS